MSVPPIVHRLGERPSWVDHEQLAAGIAWLVCPGCGEYLRCFAFGRHPEPFALFACGGCRAYYPVTLGPSARLPQPVPAEDLPALWSA